MKKILSKAAPASKDDDMDVEYDFRGDVRGKYVERLAQGSNIVVLDPDVAAWFGDSTAVNNALRAIAEIAERQRKAIGA